MRKWILAFMLVAGIVILIAVGCSKETKNPSIPDNNTTAEELANSYVNSNIPYYATPLGGVDFAGYCRTLTLFNIRVYGSDLVSPKNSSSWRCIFYDSYGYKYWTQVDANKACRWRYDYQNQYPKKFGTYGAKASSSSAYSWKCYGW